MRVHELPHSATVYPVEQMSDGEPVYLVNQPTRHKVSVTAITVPCQFIPGSRLSIEQRGLNLEITGMLIAVAGASANSVVESDGSESVVLPGSRVTVRGDSFVVVGLNTVEDLDGDVDAVEIRLKGPE